MKPLITLAFLLFAGCTASNPNIQTMKQKDVAETFKPILQLMDMHDGMAFADVGASSGEFSIMMATLMTNCAVYVEDIDTVALSNKKFDLIVDHFSKQSRRDLRKINDIHTVIGDENHTLLPEHFFDRIYTNATAHVFTNPEAMFADIRSKLKADGLLFVRDSYRTAKDTVCSDKKCARPLLTVDEFKALMLRTGFRLVKEQPNMSGYPIFGFAVK